MQHVEKTGKQTGFWYYDNGKGAVHHGKPGDCNGMSV